MSFEKRYDLTMTVPVTSGATTAGATFSVPTLYDGLFIVASLAAISTCTLDLYIQGAFNAVDSATIGGDAPGTWYDLVHFTQVSAAGTALIALSPSLTAASADQLYPIGSGTTPALAAAKVLPLPWPPFLRLLAVCSAGGAGALAKLQTVSLMTWKATR